MTVVKAAAVQITSSVDEGGTIMPNEGHARPAYLGWGAPALIGYYPKWLDNIADDATLEGSLLEGVVQGRDALRSIVVAIRSLYDRQEHKLARSIGDNRFMEEYIAEVRGAPLGCVVLVSFNAAGQTQRVLAGYRPRSSLLLLSNLLREKFAGTPLGDYFAASESETEPSLHP
jgi:hypothetical protein